MRSLLIQGMRRNGTTILFDAFLRDQRFTAFYEPLNLVGPEPLIDGGSGSHEVDLYSSLRIAQDDFLATRPAISRADLHHGAPTEPAVEYESSLPVRIRRYLTFLLAREDPWVAKFVRMGARVEILRDLAPDAVFAWSVRDPREVVRSYLFGPGGRTAHRYRDTDAVFETVSDLNAWSFRSLSDAILERAGGGPPGPLTDLDRVLIIWAESVRRLERDGPRWFGDRSVRVRHEDLCADPDRVLRSLWSLLDAAPDEDVLAWSRSAIRPVVPWEIADDDRWAERFDRAGITELAARHGYEA